MIPSYTGKGIPGVLYPFTERNVAWRTYRRTCFCLVTEEFPGPGIADLCGEAGHYRVPPSGDWWNLGGFSNRSSHLHQLGNNHCPGPLLMPPPLFICKRTADTADTADYILADCEMKSTPFTEALS
jgi:hypothetical protein